MIGHQQIIAMRIAKLRPASVHISDSKFGCDDWQKHPNAFSKQYHADVAIPNSDNVGKLDLRFLVGLKTVVTGFDSASRTEEVFNAAVKAGANPCVGFYDDEYDYFFEVVNG